MLYLLKPKVSVAGPTTLFFVPSPHWTDAKSSDEKISLIQKGQVDRARPHDPIGAIFLLHLGWCSHHHREPFNSVCLTRTPLPMNIK